ncbi:MAG: hypothetical protein QOJ18_1368, partial [Microbacteriaceae bacterium]|nr:hypothetical protein [Microbacteriaceae bacterium]
GVRVLPRTARSVFAARWICTSLMVVDGGAPSPSAAAGSCAQASEHFLDGERPADMVVGPEIECRDLLG